MATEAYEKLTKLIGVATTPNDQIRIRNAARDRHMKSSTFMRAVVLDKLEELGY